MGGDLVWIREASEARGTRRPAERATRGLGRQGAGLQRPAGAGPGCQRHTHRQQVAKDWAAGLRRDAKARGKSCNSLPNAECSGWLLAAAAAAAASCLAHLAAYCGLSCLLRPAAVSCLRSVGRSVGQRWVAFVCTPSIFFMSS